MATNLDHLTHEELGKLFPILLVDYNGNWGMEYEKEKFEIEKIIKDDSIRIEHVGSTAIPTIKSKPTIDIVLELVETYDLKLLIRQMKRIGYHFIHRLESLEPNMMFVKGYTENGFEGQSFHIHVRYDGDRDETYFRDYLLENPDIAQEYSELKIKLAKQFPNDREGYTEGKTEFVKSIIGKRNRGL